MGQTKHVRDLFLWGPPSGACALGFHKAFLFLISFKFHRILRYPCWLYPHLADQKKKKKKNEVEGSYTKETRTHAPNRRFSHRTPQRRRRRALWERPPCLLRVGKLQAQRGMCSWQMARGQLSRVWRVQGAMLSFIPHGVCFLKTVSVGPGPLTCH